MACHCIFVRPCAPNYRFLVLNSINERYTDDAGNWVRTLLDPKRVGNSGVSAHPGEMIVGWTLTEMDGVQHLRRSAKQDRRTLPRLYYNWRHGTVEKPAVAQVVRQVCNQHTTILHEYDTSCTPLNGCKQCYTVGCMLDDKRVPV